MYSCLVYTEVRLNIQIKVYILLENIFLLCSSFGYIETNTYEWHKAHFSIFEFSSKIIEAKKNMRTTLNELATQHFTIVVVIIVVDVVVVGNDDENVEIVVFGKVKF